MSYTSIFGGSPVQPSDIRYRAIALAADTTLVWPQAYVDTTDVVARINDVTPTGAGLSITMPDATQVSTGQDALFANLGADTFTILDSTGSTITTVATSVAVYIYLTDNSTAAGSWGVTTFASTTTTANAATLAGYGLTAITTTLNQDAPALAKSSGFTVDATYRAQAVIWTGGTDTAALTAAATLGDGFFFLLSNQGTGILTIDPAGSETIDGNATKAINSTESAIIVTDGTNWYSVGYGRSVSSSFTRLVKSVGGNSDVTLTAAEAAYTVQEYTGALTGDIAVIVPTSVAQFWVYNNTTGAQTLTVKTSGGSGIVVPQGARLILYCDGTNVVLANESGTVTSVGTGTGLTGGPITTSGTIALADTAVTPGTYGGANGVAEVTVDQQGRMTAASEVDLDLTAGVTGVLPIANGGTAGATEAAARAALAVPGTGTVNTFTATQSWSKGADVASASPLVLGTDGNYFDVTGTTGFAAITVAAGTFFMLQFDGILAITHGSGITLPGGANITTAVGDQLTGFATAANTVFVTAYTRASGRAVVPSGFVPIQRITSSAVATYDLTTGINSTYRSYVIKGWMQPATDDVELWLRTSANGGSSYNAGATDYKYGFNGMISTTSQGSSSGGATKIVVGGGTGANQAIGNGASERVQFAIEFEAPSVAAFRQNFSITSIGITANDVPASLAGGGYRDAAEIVDAVQLIFETGNVATGDVTLYGVTNA